MSTVSPRRVVVDDTDLGIQYTGAWFKDQGTEDSLGNFGPTFNTTQHGTIANASLSYTFSGTQINVLGTTNIRNDSGVIDPSWECFIDNISIGATAPFQYPENNWVLCEKDGLLDGSHILTVNATVRKAQTFWIDTLQYVPSSSVALDQKLVFVDSLDPQLQYGSGWGALGNTANTTSQQGSTFTFDFIGASLMWFGFIPTELPHGASTATYSIDGQTPTSFLLNGLSSSTSPTIYNQKFFETGKLNPGSHKLSVVYMSATGQSTPLTLDYLVIQNATTTSTSNGTSSTTSTGTSSNSGSNSDVGPIVGGVVGGLALICLIIFGIIFLRRQKKKKADNEATPARIIDPYFPPGPTSPDNQPFLSQTEHNYTHTGFHHGSMPSLGQTEFQSIVPPSTSSGNTYPTTQPSPFLRSPKAQREADAAAAAASARRPVQLSAALAASDSSGSSRVVLMHEDSGIRLPATPVLEVPPMYTPG